MSIHYKCRHCGVSVGKIDTMSVDSQALGFHQLDDQDRMNMISYQNDGDIHVKTICEDCHEALERNPQFHEAETFIH
ncbi:anti-sigma-F factor Fin [Bacillus pinisoli]|uniref:anti-sigma-F factor Fin n=1 Tax=Bacillus pinisoli TaxID=2901866 RepID=UPI001FF1D3C2|nr:anti-sigma-F factor Fin family protein [Bacillus pinisoli]